MCFRKRWNMLSDCLLESIETFGKCLWSILRIYLERIWERNEIECFEKFSKCSHSAIIDCQSSKWANSRVILSSTSDLLHARGVEFVKDYSTEDLWAFGDEKQGKKRIKLYLGRSYQELPSKLWRMSHRLERTKRPGNGRHHMEIRLLILVSVPQ